MCRSRRELSNDYLLAKFGFDTAENEPCKVCPLSAYRSLRSLSVLLDLKADIAQNGNAGMSPLHCACETNNKAIVEILLGKGADATAPDQSGIPLLHTAVLRLANRNYNIWRMAHTSRLLHLIIAPCEPVGFCQVGKGKTHFRVRYEAS